MNYKNPDRESALKSIAIEIDSALRIDPVAHIKHKIITEGDQGLACIETFLLGSDHGKPYCLHDWGHYGDIKATSTIFPDAPRGFVLTVKTDSVEENKRRGSDHSSIPDEAKTAHYQGDYLKIDWIYPHQNIMGKGITKNYFFAVERAAKKMGYPSLHIDATNNGFAYWARKEFGLTIPEEWHSILTELYNVVINNFNDYYQYAKQASPYINEYKKIELPKTIDPSKPYTIPRIFLEILGAMFSEDKRHLHFYKKFET